MQDHKTKRRKSFAQAKVRTLETDKAELKAPHAMPEQDAETQMSHVPPLPNPVCHQSMSLFAFTICQKPTQGRDPHKLAFSPRHRAEREAIGTLLRLV